MINELNIVYDYLRDKIADYLDVNHNHIHITSILNTGCSKHIGDDSQKEQTVKFINDFEPGKERTAILIEYKYFSGEIFERVTITD